MGKEVNIIGLHIYHHDIYLLSHIIQCLILKIKMYIVIQTYQTYRLQAIIFYVIGARVVCITCYYIDRI